MLIKKLNNQFELLQRIADGDQDAFSLYFHHHHQKILTVSKFYLKTDALAEEALQEIFLKVWVNRQKLREVKDPESWLFILAKNYLVTALEKWAKNKAAENLWITEQEKWTADSPVNYAQCQEILSSALNTLSPQQQAVFQLSKVEQFSHKQIGEQLSLSPLTVKTHLQRAMQQIRQYLTDHPLVLPLIFSFPILFL